MQPGGYFWLAMRRNLLFLYGLAGQSVSAAAALAMRAGSLSDKRNGGWPSVAIAASLAAGV